jgi:hypothetical protein
MFSLKSLLFIVAVAALGAAGLIYRTQWWASALVALTLGVLVLAICRAWFVPAGRTFWGSFALVGALYLVIVSYQPLQELHYNLPTTQVVVFALEKLQKKIPLPSPGPSVTGYYAPSTTFYAGPATTYTPGATESDGALKPPTPDAPQDAPAPTSDSPSSAPSVVRRRPVEVTTRDPVTNEATREIQEVEEVVTPGSPVSGSLLGAPLIPPPAMAYAAPMYSPAVYYNRQTLFEMAINRSFGDGFAAQARAFLWVAQCLWCLLMAFAMGMTCSWLFRRANPLAG